MKDKIIDQIFQNKESVSKYSIGEIEDILTNPIIIYGAGYCGYMFLELLLEVNLKPICIFDNNTQKIGTSILEVNIIKPTTISSYVNNATVIICVFDYDKIYSSITDNLRKLGYKKIVHIFELRNYRKLFEKQNLIISVDNLLIKQNIDNIKKVYNILNDDLSKKTFLALFDFLLADINVEIPHFPLEQQYFDYSIYNTIIDEEFIDCGAFQGNVMDIFLKNNNHKYSRYIAFEPDPFYYNIILSKKNKYKDNRIISYNVALGDENVSLKLKNYINENSVIKNDGEVKIDCVTLDNYIDMLKPTFIKIDVEGYELSLIKGAENIIKQNRPIIAIAIYHHEKDLWEIPLLLKKLSPNYKFYIRSYMNLLETVLYAIPDERCINKCLGD